MCAWQLDVRASPRRDETNLPPIVLSSLWMRSLTGNVWTNALVTSTKEGGPTSISLKVSTTIRKKWNDGSPIGTKNQRGRPQTTASPKKKNLACVRVGLRCRPRAKELLTEEARKSRDTLTLRLSVLP